MEDYNTMHVRCVAAEEEEEKGEIRLQKKDSALIDNINKKGKNAVSLQYISLAKARCHLHRNFVLKARTDKLLTVFSV